MAPESEDPGSYGLVQGILGLPRDKEAAMNRVHLRRFLSLSFLPTLGIWNLGGLAARGQTLPACVAGTVQTACTHGNVVFSNLSGVFASGYWRAQAATMDDPFNPGFSTGNIAETTHNGNLSESGSFTVATLSGMPAIAGISVTSTCGVTGAATASLSISTNNGQSLTLTCPSFTSQPVTPETSSVTQSITFAPVSSLTVTATASGAINGGSVTWTDISGQLSLNPVYDFPHLAFGGGWQTTLTYINYSPQTVSCQTTFLSDSGQPLNVPFGDEATASRSDTLQPGGSIHLQTQATGELAEGWAYAQCTGPIMASLLFRSYNGSAAMGEAGVNGMPAPAREFVTFAEYHTGVAWANPTNMPATVTIAALDAATGQAKGSTSFALPPNVHGANNIYNLFALSSTFSGSIQITATVPIVSLSLNFEMSPVFSSLPPGELPDGTTMAAGH